VKIRHVIIIVHAAAAAEDNELALHMLSHLLINWLHM
jgi:hypothetical protein